MGRHLVFGGPGGGTGTLQSPSHRDEVYVVPIVTFRIFVSCSNLTAYRDVVLAVDERQMQGRLGRD